MKYLILVVLMITTCHIAHAEEKPVTPTAKINAPTNLETADLRFDMPDSMWKDRIKTVGTRYCLVIKKIERREDGSGTIVDFDMVPLEDASRG